jgi:hypothetical protein
MNKISILINAKYICTSKVCHKDKIFIFFSLCRIAEDSMHMFSEEYYG